MAIQRAVVAFATFACLIGTIVSAQAERRLALIIGNDRYQNVPQLQKAVNDARTIGQALKGLGFTVTVAENVTRTSMSQQLVAFESSVQQGDVALFYYSGHGFEIKGENFLLPVDVPAATEGQDALVRDASFPAQRIVDALQDRGARTAILVLDACRDNPFDRPGRTRGVGGAGGLASMTDLSQGVFVLFSAGAKQTALDRLSDTDANPNSIFTRTFVRELATPGLTMVQIAKRTQSEVLQMAATVSHKQAPAYYDEVIGDIVLNGKEGDASPVAAAPLPQVAALPPPTRAPPPPAPTPSNEAVVNGPIANFMRSNSGWSVTFSFIDPVTAITWRMGETGNFKETGFLDTFDSRTRKRMPNPNIQLDGDTAPGTIYVRFADTGGNWNGPFPVRFDPNAALENSQRKILELTSGSWLAFGGVSGPLVYYTQLVTYRCAIREVRIGIDTSIPDKALPMPPCDTKAPNDVPGNFNPYMKIAPTVKSVSVELTYRDGTTSEIKTFKR